MSGREGAGGGAERRAVLGRRIERLTESTLRECFGCRKCSAGCPVAAVADLLPHELVQALLLRRADRVLGSRFLWLCVGCQTCLTRCPNRVDIPKAVDAARSLALAAGIPAAEREVLVFHNAFLATVRRHGRLHELSMIRRYKTGTRNYFGDLGLGLRLWRRGKISLFASGATGRDQVRALFDHRGEE